MNRGGFLSASTAASLTASIAAHAFQVEKSKLSGVQSEKVSLPDPGKVPSFTVEVASDRGVKGYGNGGPGGGTVVKQHLEKLLLGEDPP